MLVGDTGPAPCSNAAPTHRARTQRRPAVAKGQQATARGGCRTFEREPNGTTLPVACRRLHGLRQEAAPRVWQRSGASALHWAYISWSSYAPATSRHDRRRSRRRARNGGIATKTAVRIDPQRPNSQHPNNPPLSPTTARRDQVSLDEIERTPSLQHLDAALTNSLRVAMVRHARCDDERSPSELTPIGCHNTPTKR